MPITHGHTINGKASPTYTTWDCIIQRCTNPNHVKFYRYGGAGITVCERWLTFANFLEDMGERPEGKTIDRIKGALEYAKENCKWSTIGEQQRNLKVNRWITFEGETKCLEDWCKTFGLAVPTVIYRLRKGWPLDAAFRTDPDIHNRVGARVKGEYARKLTYELAEEMRKLRKETGLSYAKIGQKFGVRSQTACSVCHYKMWRGDNPEFMKSR